MKKPSRRRKAGELSLEQAQAALVRFYSYTQQQWHSELVSHNPDWIRLFDLHNDMLQIETQAPAIAEF